MSGAVNQAMQTMALQEGASAGGAAEHAMGKAFDKEKNFDLSQHNGNNELFKAMAGMLSGGVTTSDMRASGITDDKQTSEGISRGVQHMGMLGRPIFAEINRLERYALGQKLSGSGIV